MHVYIMEINTSFIKVEALKLIDFLQEDIFPRWNLIANSVANVQPRHWPKHRQICKFYDAHQKSYEHIRIGLLRMSDKKYTK